MITKMYYDKDSSNEFIQSESVENYTDDGRKMSWMSFRTIESRYCSHYIKTNTVSGIGTRPEYRRAGSVRVMLDKLFEIAPEREWVVSFLHPFSFAYYRKFGYEKVADHLIVEFPMEAISFIERNPDLLPVDSVKRASDCVSVYNEFANKRNIMFRRTGTWEYPTTENNDNRRTYIWYDCNGKPASYITFDQQQFYNINVMESIALNVYELVFTTKESLTALFGFIRMFEGEDKRVKIHNCAMSPEVESILRNYMHTKYTVVPDIAARIFDVGKILELNDYGTAKGHFSIEIVNDLSYTNGIYTVEFENGKAEAKRMAGITADIVCSMPSFTQLVYGYNEFDSFRAGFLENVRVNNTESDFFKAYHKKYNGLFEHF